MRKLISIKSQKGVTLIEYVLIASLIAVASVAVMTLLGTQISNTFKSVCTAMGGTC
jgi:pilus assembly protein Flp/PilA